MYRDLLTLPACVRQLADAPAYYGDHVQHAHPPLDDVRVRQRARAGYGSRDDRPRRQLRNRQPGRRGPLAPFYWAVRFTPLRPTPYDPSRARALLDAAGWRPGADGVRVRDGRRLSLLLVYGIGSADGAQITVQIQQMYRAIGVDVQLKGFDYATLYAAAQSGGILNGGKFDLAMYAWDSGSDPDDSSQWMCSMAPPAGNNIAHYCSPEMDAAQRLALSTFERSIRKRAYARIQELLLRDAPAAFMYYQSLRYAHAADLQNFMPNGISEAWNAQEWRR